MADSFTLGPSDGSLRLHTTRTGAAAKMGHDLVLEVQRWSAQVDDPGVDPGAVQAQGNEGSWAPISAYGFLPGRYWQSAVWTGRQLLIWGGLGVEGPFANGAAYDPADDSWRRLPYAGGFGPRSPGKSGEAERDQARNHSVPEALVRGGSETSLPL